MEKDKITKYSFINSRLIGQENSPPKALYKYRPFDVHAFDMLENDYLFLCKVENLDDPSECKTKLSLDDFYKVNSIELSYRVVDGILAYLRPYTSEKDYEQICNLVYSTMAPNGSIRRNYILDVSFEIAKRVPSLNVAWFVNFFGSIPESINKPEMRREIEERLILAGMARSEMGVCSLTELSNSPEMWDKYADKSTGYCVQYSIEEYDYKQDLFPVVYSNERNTDVISAVIGSYIGYSIFRMTRGEFDADMSQYTRLFLTKNTVWDYQKEWRIFGAANEKINSPKIEAIHIGKNASEENKIRIEEYCKCRGILLIQQ